jgi:hypothetical protein
MRRVAYALVVVVFAVSAFGSPRSPREEPRSRDREISNPIVKAVKKVIKSLGDGLTIPS